ncbi:DUF177 domain-containing protein [Leuconostoc holzapfelii]|uniref:DUF177 domain-containing protein n=1 Tax=Leuconostoc holzapfelii TaxID=434464 RepID=A0ABT2NU20_9LACO|nr:YceD family protein [Leuconostoc holzapfelii]MCT8388652.1 DUF177 domain-containing protein [Leuconostoc holzapfelii]
MKFNKNQLQKYRQQALTIDETLDLAAMAQARFENTILALSPLQVTGQIRYVDHDDLLLHAHIVGQVTVPSSRSLAPVELAVDMTIDERYIEEAARLDDFEETDAVFVLENDTLNVDEAILDNIVAALPLQILTPEEIENETLPAGKDWHVISEEAFENEKKAAADQQLDPRLAKLDDFFKE